LLYRDKRVVGVFVRFRAPLLIAFAFSSLSAATVTITITIHNSGRVASLLSPIGNHVDALARR
jgi:hypothetical protein